MIKIFDSSAQSTLHQSSSHQGLCSLTHASLSSCPETFETEIKSHSPPTVVCTQLKDSLEFMKKTSFTDLSNSDKTNNSMLKY